MAKVRKRTWKSGGKEKTAWVADYFDQNGKRHIKTFDLKRKAAAWLAQTQIDVKKGPRTAGARRHCEDQPLMLVWSEEQAAWWGPGGVGYTSRMGRAGRFTATDAAELVKGANRYCGPGEWNEVAIPDPMRKP